MVELNSAVVPVSLGLLGLVLILVLALAWCHRRWGLLGLASLGLGLIVGFLLPVRESEDDTDG